MINIAPVVHERLSKGESVVLAKIIRQQGSAPRTVGTQMVVTRDGKHSGTIGGGLLEARVIGQSLRLMDEGSARFEHFELGHEEVASMDMICGGNVEVFLDPLSPSEEMISLLGFLRQLAEDKKEGVFATVILRSHDRIERVSHGLLEMDGRVHGQLPLSPDEVTTLLDHVGHSDVMTSVDLKDRYVVLEPLQTPPTAIFVGAGHVAQPSAHFASRVGFRVIVMDDREAFANKERFPDADQVVVLAGFQAPFSAMTINRNSFIIIVTRGHLYDKIVLANALKSKAGYIGMIGSRHKRNTIFRQLLKDGFSEEDLKRVHSPIGMNIGAETPEEIGVSIVAELIAHRRHPRSVL